MSFPVRIIPFAIVLASLALAPVCVPLRADTDGVEASSGHTWAAIRDDTYSQRAHFSDGVTRLSALLDKQIGELKAKRAAMTTDTGDWDFQFKQVTESRTLLTDRMNHLDRADTPETWEDAKQQVGEAWSKVLIAVDKMNATRTS
jgi:hypothetical protein